MLGSSDAGFKMHFLHGHRVGLSKNLLWQKIMIINIFFCGSTSTARAKWMEKIFNLVEPISSMKLLSPHYTLVTWRSETCWYMSTPHRYTKTPISFPLVDSLLFVLELLPKDLLRFFSGKMSAYLSFFFSCWKLTHVQVFLTHLFFTITW